MRVKVTKLCLLSKILNVGSDVQACITSVSSEIIFLVFPIRMPQYLVKTSFYCSVISGSFSIYKDVWITFTAKFY